MKKFIIWPLITLLSLVTLGCATVGGGVAENLKSIPPNRGLVLFSTSADKTNLASTTCLRLVEGSTLRSYDKVIINLDYPFFGAPFHVRSLVLPEGWYYLQPTSVNPHLAVTETPIYRFRVRAGSATHIGNFHLSLSQVSRPIRSRKIHGSLVWSSETYARDVEYFRSKNPESNDISFQRQTIEFGPSCSTFRTQGTIEELPQ